jgi:hypothetical protein
MEAKVIVVLSILVMLSIAVPTLNAASEFGFNYWPYQGSCYDLRNGEWTYARQQDFKKDLNLMASYGCKMVRFMFYPAESGYILNIPGGGGYFDPMFWEMKANFVNDVLPWCEERGMKVTVTFGNNYLWGPGHPWWFDAYGNTDTGFYNFLADSWMWIEEIVLQIENSSYASTVVYYDMQNEVSDNIPRQWDYLNFVYDNCSIPSGKRGVSYVNYDDEAETIKNELGPSRPLDYAEFHVYPDFADAPSLDYSYNESKLWFPSSKLVLGEFGGVGPDPQDLYETIVEPSTEQSQQNTVVNVINWANSKSDLEYHLYWMLWDKTPENSAVQLLGWGYNPDQPKDVMGKMSEMLSQVYNGDFELGTSGWTAGSTTSHTFAVLTSDIYAATNSKFARLKMTNASGQGWMHTNFINVSGNKDTYINAWIRSNMSNVYLRIDEYRSNGSWIRSHTGTSFNPWWAWINYVRTVGSCNFTTHSNTRKIVINIIGSSTANPCYLDVDCVSASQ